MSQADLKSLKQCGLQAKRRPQSVLQVVPTEDAIEAIQEAIEKDPRKHTAASLARLRGAAAQPEIEAASGPAITAATAAERMQRSPRTVRNLIQKGKLIGYRPAANGAKLLLPLWQFDGKGVGLSWVPALVEVYGANGISILNFITVPRIGLDGGNYLHLLRNGQWETVISAARRSNPD